MTLRIFGLVLLFGSILLGAVAVSSLARMSEQAGFVGRLSQAFEAPIDTGDWAARWRIAGIGMGVLAIGGCAGGLGFILRRRFAWAALTFGLSAYTVIQLAMRLRGPREYAFEPDWKHIAVATAFTMACGWATWRGRSSTTRAT